MMDFGSGPGTAVWSATQIWPEISNILAVEPSEAMIDLARNLCKGTTGGWLKFPFLLHLIIRSTDKPVQWRRLLPTDPNERYDVVTASYVLSELPNDEERMEKIKSLWKHTRRGGILVRRKLFTWKTV